MLPVHVQVVWSHQIIATLSDAKGLFMVSIATLTS